MEDITYEVEITKRGRNGTEKTYDVIYKQIVESLDLKKVIDAVNPTV